MLPRICCEFVIFHLSLPERELCEPNHAQGPGSSAEPEPAEGRPAAAAAASEWRTGTGRRRRSTEQRSQRSGRGRRRRRRRRWRPKSSSHDGTEEPNSGRAGLDGQELPAGQGTCKCFLMAIGCRSRRLTTAVTRPHFSLRPSWFTQRTRRGTPASLAAGPRRYFFESNFDSLPAPEVLLGTRIIQRVGNAMKNDSVMGSTLLGRCCT